MSSHDTPGGRRGALIGWWAGLSVLSVVLAALFDLAALPAGLLIGPMLAGVAVAVMGADLAVPRGVVFAAQAVIGCLVAASLEPALFAALLSDWPILLGAAFATLVASGALGVMIARFGILPGTTAIWGSAPGAASAMVVIAEAFGADARLVAFMQFVRVLMVSLAAALIARFFVDTTAVPAPARDWFQPIDTWAFATTLAVAVAGACCGRLLRLPAAMFLGPLIIGVAVHAGAGWTMQLPEWLLAASYVVIGWWIGLRFDRSLLRHALRSLPQIMLSVVLLIAFCGCVAWLLAQTLGIDPLTAYLATTPGGLDTVAIIAAASGGVDIAFVMALQMMRFLIVLVLGPPAARWLAARMSAR